MMLYLSLLKDSGVRWPLVFAFIGRIPLYMVNLALVLWASEGSSFVVSGLMVGLFNVGGAVGGVVLARMADRRGSFLTLLLTSAVQCLCLVILGVLGIENAVVAGVLVVIAGFFTPPISSIMRNYWSRLPESQRDPAYAVESIVGELLSVIGPLVLSGILVFSGSSSQALVVSGVLVVTGSVSLALTPGIRKESVAADPRVIPDGHGSAVPRRVVVRQKLSRSVTDSLSIFKSGGFTGLFVRRSLEAVSNGAFDVAIPAFAIWLGSEAYSGSLYSALGIGSIAGGIFYGLHKWKAPKEKIYCWGLLLSAIGMSFPLFAGDYGSMSVALGMGALSFAPVAAVEYSLIARTSAPLRRSQAFAWMTTAGVIGSAVGSQTAGIITTYFGFRATFAVAAAIALLAALFAWPLRKYWKEPVESNVTL